MLAGGVEPGDQGCFALRIVGHVAEAVKLAPDLLGPAAGRVGKKRKVEARFCGFGKAWNPSGLW